jgi:hypothetical protein
MAPHEARRGAICATASTASKARREARRRGGGTTARAEGRPSQTGRILMHWREPVRKCPRTVLPCGPAVAIDHLGVVDGQHRLRVRHIVLCRMRLRLDLRLPSGEAARSPISAAASRLFRRNGFPIWVLVSPNDVCLGLRLQSVNATHYRHASGRSVAWHADLAGL